MWYQVGEYQIAEKFSANIYYPLEIVCVHQFEMTTRYKFISLASCSEDANYDYQYYSNSAMA